MRLTVFPTHPVLAHRNERGQTLILFVAIFSVVLALAAFSLDQGLWLGHRRVVQKDADTAARGGAYALTLDSTDLVGAAQDAQTVALQNGVQSGAPQCGAGSGRCASFTGRPDCTDYNGHPLIGVPSVEVKLTEPTRALFSGSFGIKSVDTGASATACVGSVNAIGPGNGQVIPNSLAYAPSGCAGNACGCFTSSGTTLNFGQECEFELKHGSLLDLPSTGFCEGGSGNPHDVAAALQAGIDFPFTCSVNPCPVDGTGACTSSGAGCGGGPHDDCVSYRNGALGVNDLDAFVNRLASDPCNPPNSTDGLTVFKATFARVDGQPVNGPPGLGGSDPSGTLYVQQQCASPRVVINVITDTSQGAVKGFAVVFIVGCSAPPTPRLDDCSGANPGNAQIMGIPLQLLLNDQSIVGIGPPTPNSPLAILMFK
jgi:hypothetical protein